VTVHHHRHHVAVANDAAVTGLGVAVEEVGGGLVADSQLGGDVPQRDVGQQRPFRRR
jgi:hypothetical protein